MKLENDIDMNIEMFDEVFKDCGDRVSRKFPIGETVKVWVYVTYIDGLVNRSIIENSALNNLIVYLKSARQPREIFSNVYEAMRDCGVASADIMEAEDFETAADAIMSGDCVFIIDGFHKAIVMSAKGWPNRGVGTNETEIVIQGSKEAFSEVLRINTSLIRRRIRDTHLKVLQLTLGRRSQTSIAVMYLEGVARSSVLADVRYRLDQIDIDGILDSGYIEQYFETGQHSVFPLVQTTERPDKAASAILEGRVAIIVDNSPFIVIVPATVSTFYQASEDFYQRWHIASFVRLMRYAAALIAMFLPAFYVAVCVYHPDLVPTQFALKMAAARINIPFPGVIEILAMELAFELLREAGIRLPAPIGGTIGIVGGLMVGQAAVEAGIVSQTVVIVVAITAIASFALPHVTFSAAIRLVKFFALLLSAVLGLFGFCIAGLVILTHAASLKSFGFPYLFPFTSGEINGFSDIKDTLFRAPLTSLKKRPIFANPSQSVRMAEKKPE